VLAASLIVIAALVAWLIHSPALELMVPRTAFQFRPYDDNVAMPTVVIEVLVTIIVLGALFPVLAIARKTIHAGLAGMIIIATFAIVESVTYAHLKVSGPQTWTYPAPFRSLNYFNVLPSVMRPPGNAKLAKFAEKLEVADYRSMLVNGPSPYPWAKSPHIAAFWRMRTMAGYGTGVPYRMAQLPWADGVQVLRTLEFQSAQDVDPALLALLNVKYIIFFTPDLYFNVASSSGQDPRAALTIGGTTYPGETMNIDGVKFAVVRNPVTPLPRHFLAESVTGVPQAPRFVTESSTTAPDGKIDAPATSIVLTNQIARLTRHSFAEGLTGTDSYDASGTLLVSYRDDIIDVRVAPSKQERFVVINERYHPMWEARIGDQQIPVFPTNAVMLGIRIPAEVDHVVLRFEPLASKARAVIFAAFAALGVLSLVIWSRPIVALMRRARARWKHQMRAHLGTFQ
jgi:hypothetical protein